MTEHRPLRPTWDCVGCGGDWPCHTRRHQLLAEYTGARVSLGLLMAANFVEACFDMPRVDAGLLYDRFIGWIRERPPPT